MKGRTQLESSSTGLEQGRESGGEELGLGFRIDGGGAVDWVRREVGVRPTRLRRVWPAKHATCCFGATNEEPIVAPDRRSFPGT